MIPNPSGIRNIQITRSLITVRWASIPIILGFSIICLKLLGMSFRIEPIYLICCCLAILNIFFTFHLSLLSRQMMLSHGMNSLKRLLIKVASGASSGIKSDGIRGILRIPIVISRVCAIFYLVLLESLKDLSFNLLSLKNIMHTQVICDIVAVVLITRYTGTTESPMLLMLVMPITVVGAVMGLKTGIVYTFIGVFSWLLVCLLVKYDAISHIKFYSPSYGDLSQSSGWIIANFGIFLTGLIGVSFLANKLTVNFKERIYYLNNLLHKSNAKASLSSASLSHISGAWLTTDSEGNVEKIKSDYNGIFSYALLGKNLLEAFPELENHGMKHMMQTVVASNTCCSLAKVKIDSKDDEEYFFDMKISSLKDIDDTAKILIILEDRTKEVYVGNQLEALKEYLCKLEKTHENSIFKNEDTKKSLDEAKKYSDEKALEIDVLSKKIKTLKLEEGNRESEITSLMNELTAVNILNEQISSELQYKQILLDEIEELMNSCIELDKLIPLIEKRARELFKFDNAFLHVFNCGDSNRRRNEILDIHKASPRLLKVPYSNIEVLNPILEYGRPVFINTQINPEKMATMEIIDGQLKCLTAYIPIRHHDETIGVMMLEKYGHEENSDLSIKLVSYYLKHSAIAMKNAILFKESGKKNENIHEGLNKLLTLLDHIKTIVFSDSCNEEQPYLKLLTEITKCALLEDAILVKINIDNSSEVYCRINQSRESKLSVAENKLLNAVVENPHHRITLDAGSECEYTCACIPLFYGSRLFGVVFIYFSEDSKSEDAIIDFCIRILRDQFVLNTLNEEREVWESFYKSNLLSDLSA